MVNQGQNNPPATYAELEALPDNVVGEIVNGRLIATPRPAPTHAETSSGLGILLGGPYRYGIGGPGGWRIIDEPELHLGDDVLVPDLAGWRLERMPDLPSTPFFDLAPDWICEVLSPSTERIDRGDKLAIYRREGVPHVWLVNPLSQTLEVLRLAEDGYLLVAVHTAAEVVRAPPFDAVQLDLGLLFGAPPSADPG